MIKKFSHTISLLTILVTTFSTVLVVTSPASALSIKTANDLNIDTSILREDTNFNLPTKIIIAPIYTPSSELEIREDEWYRGIYYYTVDILGFNDIPFHYLVTKTGKVYQGNKGGYERKISVNGIGDGIILIGYMTDKTATKIDARAKDELIQLLTQIASENSLNPENIEFAGITFKRNTETKSVTIEKTELFGLWNSSLIEIIPEIQNSFSPVSKEYNVTVDLVTLPQAEVEPGTQIDIPIKFTNVSQSGIYGGSMSEIVVTKATEGDSNFFLNNIWFSKTQAGVMGESDVLMPYSEGSFNLKIRVPLIYGAYSETFDIRNGDGKKISEQTFDILLNIKRTERPIVEILSTETGLLNVRVEPSSVGETISQVSSGQRFFKTNDAGNGWIEIELDDGQKGWIASWYTREI